MANDNSQNNGKDTVVVERDNKSYTGVVIAVVILVVVLLLVFGVFGSDSGGETDINVDTPTPTEQGSN